MTAPDIAGLCERPFVVTVIAQSATKAGYRCGFVWARSEDEAIGRFVRFAEAENPGWTISTPAALHITDENLQSAYERHSTTPASPTPSRYEPKANEPKASDTGREG